LKGYVLPLDAIRRKLFPCYDFSEVLFYGYIRVRSSDYRNGVAFHKYRQANDMVAVFMGNQDSLELRWTGACLPQAFDEEAARQAGIDK
jgi:hypothetical protein